MSAIDRISQLQSQGIQEGQIVRQLQSEGFSPKEIQDSFNHLEIKNAVSNSSSDDSMRESIMGSEGSLQKQATPNPTPNPPVQSQPNPNEYLAQNLNQGYPASPEIYPPKQNYSEENYYSQNTPYTNQDYYMPQNSADTDTISEIAEQVFSDKFSEFTKKTGDLISFKNSIQDKVFDLDNRLRRLEETIDKLQSAIIGRIGDFAENSSLIHKDLDNLHNTMSKMMNPLMDNYKELKKIAEKN